MLDVVNDYQKIYLQNSDDFFIVDSDDYKNISLWNWRTNKNGKICAHTCSGNYSLMSLFKNKYDINAVKQIINNNDHRKSNLLFCNYYVKCNDYYKCYIFDRFFIFDIEDYEIVKDYIWSITKSGYISGYQKGSKTYKKVMLHRLIMGIADCKDKNIVVDHIYHNKLDNRKSQLRIVTTQQNVWNSLKSKNSKNVAYGIKNYMKADGTTAYQAYITVNRKQMCLGTYIDLDEAIDVRKKAEKKYFGEYAPKIKRGKKIMVDQQLRSE